MTTDEIRAALRAGAVSFYAELPISLNTPEWRAGQVDRFMAEIDMGPDAIAVAETLSADDLAQRARMHLAIAWARALSRPRRSRR